MNRIKRALARLLLRWESSLRQKPTPPDQSGVIKLLADKLAAVDPGHDYRSEWLAQDQHEAIEAQHLMRGAGPWLSAENRQRVAEKGVGAKLVQARESIGAQGSMGDLELALQSVEWRREVNLSWLEFSRWGIQQIILISRLYYIKNPIIRRLINVDAYYVFGRGVEISSTDDSIQAAITDFLDLNDSELGQVALSEHQKRTNYDGNLFFVFFPDRNDSGACPMRLIDATEIQEIITNPDDTNEEWYFRRTWVMRTFDETSGITGTTTGEVWYPAVGYDPVVKLEFIAGHKVEWDSPVLHRRYGAAGKWTFGCPVIYPALDWAKAARRYLEACATLAASYAQIAMTITTKGGQQALAGVKQQLETTVGPSTQLWDTNPTAVNASVFASGPGTTLAAFHSRGQGLDPTEVKQFCAMAAICMDVPPTFLGDLETANLATATSLDRPTELAFMHKQEAWRELLVQILTYVLGVQLRAPGGALRESLQRRGIDPATVRIREAPKVRTNTGRLVYMTEAQRANAGKAKKDSDLEIKVAFPAIREGDIPALTQATVQAMTLDNKGGQIVGIDEKEGIRKLFQLCGIEEADEIVEKMYPSSGKDKYDPNRTKEDAAAIKAPISSRPPFAAPGPQAPGGHPQALAKQPAPTPGQEALTRLGAAADRLKEALSKRNAA